MRLGRDALALMLLQNVIELRFRRRKEKPGFSDYRRMLCSNDRNLLLSKLGREILNYDPPKGFSLSYDPKSKNLVIAYDIFMQNFRAINCNDVEVVSVIKTSPDATEFWKYFNENIYPMSAEQKASFMNK
jgi:hypothetical protein